VEFLAEGLDAGERCWYLGSSDVAALRTDLQELGPVDELVGCDALRLVPIEAGYGPDPAQTVRGWRAPSRTRWWPAIPGCGW